MSQGGVELEFGKGVKIAWRNIHYQATKILPNQYLWIDIMRKYRDDFEGDFEQGVFAKAEQRMEEEEDKYNQAKETAAKDRERIRKVDKALVETAQKIRARSRVDLFQLAYLWL